MGQQFLGGGGGGGANNGGLNISSFSNIVQHANDNSQGGSEEQDMFGRVAGMLQNNAGNMNTNDVDEQRLMEDHSAVNNGDGNVGSGQIGNAAALGAIKNMLSGSSDNSGGSNSSFQEKIVGMAMSNAGSLYDQKNSNGQADGSKEDAMHKAGEMAMKLLMKHEMGSMMGGGQSGGLSSLASMLM